MADFLVGAAGFVLAMEALLFRILRGPVEAAWSRAKKTSPSICSNLFIRGVVSTGRRNTLS
jgi:hypothetical protein